MKNNNFVSPTQSTCGTAVGPFLNVTVKQEMLDKKAPSTYGPLLSVSSKIFSPAKIPQHVIYHQNPLHEIYPKMLTDLVYLTCGEIIAWFYVVIVHNTKF